MKQCIGPLSFGLLVGLLAAIGWQIAYVGKRIEAQTSAYICIEALKLKIDAKSCAGLLNERPNHEHP